MKQSFVSLTLLLLLSVPSASQAADLMDWLEEAGKALHTDESADAGDHASLLTLEPGENEMYPKVSPDGNHLLVVSTHRGKSVISQRMLENGDPINVVGDYDQQVMDSAAWYGPDKVTFLSYRENSLDLWEKPVDGGSVRKLYRRLDGELRFPVLLNNGEMIVARMTPKHGTAVGHRGRQTEATFIDWDRRGYQYNLTLITEQGAEKVLSPGSNPALSPDGSRLVFTMQDGHFWHLFMMNTDGSDLVQLTSGEHVDAQPVWSPDGSWIAFTSNRGDEDEDDKDGGHSSKQQRNWDIWLIGRDGSNLTRLTTNKASDGAPSFANNGRIYFHSDRKVSREESKSHQVRGRTSGFHIWTILLPAKVS
ncbi:TolB family protein [Mariprofundus ferrooxydans]|uniref:TolB family protein n=1 Tax=Mariprofundus ferrooxydans TaxID=314344 RepID=UPI00142F87CC|nr:PD40 domain-containing protein [Mariprofundus ferrooxydans]